MKDYLMLITAAALLAVDFALNKLYQRSEGTSLKTGFKFNALIGIFTSIIFFVANGFELKFSIYSVMMAAIMSILVMIYNIIGFRVLKSGGMALYTLFIMTGGMIVPYVWGLLFLNESFSLIRTVGLLLIIFAVIISNFSNKKANIKQIILCVAVFFLNGFVSVISKLHQIELNFVTVSTTEFVIISGICKFIIAGIAYIITTNDEQNAGTKKSVLLIIVGSAVISGVSYALQLFGAQNLPATVLYPFITGGSMVCSTIVGVVAFKEKLSKALILSIALCFIGTFMFL